jgi:hypothetical protein
MRRNLISFTLGIVIGIFILTWVQNRGGVSTKDIATLKAQNDSLHKENLKLDSLENTYLVELNKANYEVLRLENEDNALEGKVKYMDKEIKIIKTKYEKAKHYADSYGSDDIKRYFANLR